MYRTLFFVFSVTALGFVRPAIAQTKESFDGFKFFDKNGNIQKPGRLS